MNAVFVTNDIDVFRDGSDAQARMLTYSGLVDSLTVFVLCRKKDKCQEVQLSDHAVLVPVNASYRWRYVRDTVRLGSALKDVDIVIADDPFMNGLAALRIAQAHDALFQLQIHTDFLHESFIRGSFYRKVDQHIARELLSQADCILAVSPHLIEAIEREHLITGARPMLLPVYIDLSYLDGPPAFSLHVKYPQHKFIILMDGALTRERDYETACNVLRNVRAENNTVGMIVLGEGSLRTRLAAYVEKHGIDDAVQFVGRQDDLRSYYQGADMYLLTALTESMGLSLLRASHCAKPIVTTRVGMVPWLYRDHESAIVCGRRDVSCMVNAVKTLIVDNTLRLTLGRAARDVAHDIVLDHDEYKKRIRLTLLTCKREMALP